VPAVLLALCSSVLWGATDFVGGRLVRRHPVATISLLSHFTGCASEDARDVLSSVHAAPRATAA
jgi:hypothetical protein